MGSKKRENPYLDSWKETLKDKTKEELVEIIYHSEKYAPEFIEMVKEKLKKEYDTIIEGPKSTAIPDEAIKNGFLADNFASVVKVVIIFTVLGFFAFLCIWEAIESFSFSYFSSYYLAGGWWCFAALLTISAAAFYLLVKFGDSSPRKTERGFPIEELEQENQRGYLLKELSRIGCEYDSVDGDMGPIHFKYKGMAFVSDWDNMGDYSPQILRISIAETEKTWLNDFGEVSNLWNVFDKEDVSSNIIMICTMNDYGCELKVRCVQKIFFPIGTPYPLYIIGDNIKIVLNELSRVHSIVQRELNADIHI